MHPHMLPQQVRLRKVLRTEHATVGFIHANAVHEKMTFICKMPAECFVAYSTPVPYFSRMDPHVTRQGRFRTETFAALSAYVVPQIGVYGEVILQRCGACIVFAAVKTLVILSPFLVRSPVNPHVGNYLTADFARLLVAPDCHRLEWDDMSV